MRDDAVSAGLVSDAMTAGTRPATTEDTDDATVVLVADLLTVSVSEDQLDATSVAKLPS